MAAAKQAAASRASLQIIVVQAGWVLVGHPIERPETDSVEITEASCIRVWGTDRGLGQLALEGPQKNTRIDPIGRAFVRSGALLFSIACEEKAWTHYWK